MIDHVKALSEQINGSSTLDRIGEAQAVLEAAGYTVLPFGVLQEISGNVDNGLASCRDRLADELMSHTAMECGPSGDLTAKVYVVAPDVLSTSQRQSI